VTSFAQLERERERERKRDKFICQVNNNNITTSMNNIKWQAAMEAQCLYKMAAYDNQTL